MVLSSSWKRSLAWVLVFAATALQGCRAEQPWPLWQKYCERFYDAQGRIIDHGADDRSTSEGQAYAMFFALVVNDQKKFETLLHWTENNLANGDLTTHLPAWSWGKAPDGSWKVLDANPASDADLWLAYDLLEAGRLWKMPRYTGLGKVIADRMAHDEVRLIPGVGTVLLPGPQGFQHEGANFLLNPSYMAPQLLARLAQETDGPWNQVAESLPLLLGQGSGKGFAMDWVAAGSGVHPSPTPQQLAEGKNDAVPVGSYDAIRVYLWLGMADRNTPGVESALPEIQGMGNYLKQNVIPPLQVDATGKVLNDAGTIGFSAAVVPYLAAVGQKKEAKKQMDRLIGKVDPKTGLYGSTPEYYDQNLSLFATGWMEQRFKFERDGRLKLKWK